jgi:hypothetical protein
MGGAPTPVAEIVEIDVGDGLGEWIRRVFYIVFRAKKTFFFGDGERNGPESACDI